MKSEGAKKMYEEGDTDTLLQDLRKCLANRKEIKDGMI